MAVVHVGDDIATELALNIGKCSLLGPLPYSIANERGSLAKSSRFRLMHDLENLVQLEETPSPTSHQVIILDGTRL